MATEKGMFKDIERRTAEHQQICSWFIDRQNAYRFIAGFLNDEPIRSRTILEEPVTAKTGFLYGFADVLLDYTTDQEKREVVLIEAKSSMADLGATLRQIRTYQRYLPDITKTCLVFQAPGQDDSDSLRQFFGTQGIYTVSFNELPHYGGWNDPEPDEQRSVPSGLRPATICGVDFAPHRQCLTFEIFVDFEDERRGKTITDLVSSPNFFFRQTKFLELLHVLGIPTPQGQPEGIRPGDISISCSADVRYPPDDFGSPDLCIENLHFGNQILPLTGPYTTKYL